MPEEAHGRPNVLVSEIESQLSQSEQPEHQFNNLKICADRQKAVQIGDY
jgi:hypothetical protein